MAEEPTPIRRYCGVCGYLSSEPMGACPRCAVASTHVPQVAPISTTYPPDGPYFAARRPGPPAWVVITILLILAVTVVLVTLAVDGAFGAALSAGVVGPLPLGALGLPL